MFLAPIIHYVSDTNYVDVGCYIYTCELHTKRNPNLPKITISYMILPTQHLSATILGERKHSI